MKSDHSLSSSLPRSPHSIIGMEDIVMPGFGCEFGTKLEEALRWKRIGEEAKLDRYAQFGMTEDDIRYSTPEYMREEYERQIQTELESFDNGTPFPLLVGYHEHLPSSPKSPESVRNSLTTIKNKRASAQTKSRTTATGRKKRAAVSYNRRVQRSPIAKSIHPMKTRARKQRRLETGGMQRR
ncbi:hypothetical protein MMC30_008269 [Trapelia coarctata]|nr:hypothetical protein [Trapelia coarctata]